ncbi:glycosyltransferase family 2 protein [Novosphingobium sp. RD2P27]|uniref:Glycosyltransferase family 2 protein n=1 Tax=Novosphingobium kalidii TaxID=3230299 RepID=A0ABV2D4R4_9SPHN
MIVGIPTYKRPVGLARLLDGLAKLETQHSIEIVVAENDCERQTGEAVCQQRIAEGYLHPISVVMVDPRGISEARNALVQWALVRTDATFLAMIDDDEVPSSAWLDQLISVHARFDADVVGGPVQRVFDAKQMPDHLRRFNQTKTKSDRDGLIKSIESTGNICFRLSFLTANKEERFDSAFSMTGGGDRDFLQRLKRRGAKFAWAADALVFETFPESRCTEAWSRQRAFRVGNSEMLAGLKNRPPNFMIKHAVQILISVAYLGLAHSFLLPSKYHRFASRQAVMRSRGKIAALRGRRFSEYHISHGT